MNVDAGNDPGIATPPRGRFVYSRTYGEGETTYERVKAEATEQGTNWGPVAAGLIVADAETLAVYFRNIDAVIQRRGWG